MAALQASIPAAAGGAVGVAEVETTLESERRAAEETRLKNLELDLNEHHASEYENLERTKDGQIKNLKDQTAYFLARKDDEIRALTLEHDNYRREKEAECERLHEECEYLHGWAMSMNSVLENVESGAYPVVEAGGLRTLTIPLGEKPGSLDVPTLASEGGGRAQVPRGDVDADADGSVRKVSVSERRRRRPVVKLARTTTNSAADAFELEAFKTHGDLIDAERAAVADATLRELSSHPTVEYIRHLEEENARITSQLSKATAVGVGHARRAQLGGAPGSTAAPSSRRPRCRASAPRGRARSTRARVARAPRSFRVAHLGAQEPRPARRRLRHHEIQRRDVRSVPRRRDQRARAHAPRGAAQDERVRVGARGPRI